MLYVKFGKNRLCGVRDVFENVTDRQTTDAWLYYKLTHEPSAKVS